ncbi:MULTISPECIES: hypothetical protein [unclassified Bacillus (in: firmicutes)]|uniref:hypothetical protein n=1 Tax=unclassified Bacillus (in: firmicutes) TaxID=185979 RepID=UPI00227F60A0|nr:hypothetical protein [Bacillus sp. S20C3]MCY8204611.1 hypothetical protein [Bacillus sp. N12A5]MCY8288347.1 hypothetical protein [Bacillus sp. N13C7]MCY8638558.1 hypothetical protein [Bacillus sp. S17B2]MCY8719253.1 hypothetical protein [Bacillus sp. S10C12M]MCY9142643.1 hypothetical protein [Bacillus sp. T9C1]
MQRAANSLCLFAAAFVFHRPDTADLQMLIADAALQRRNHWAAEADIGMKGLRTAFAG